MYTMKRHKRAHNVLNLKVYIYMCVCVCVLGECGCEKKFLCENVQEIEI